MKKYTSALLAMMLLIAPSFLLLRAVEAREQPPERVELRSEGLGLVRPDINSRTDTPPATPSRRSTRPPQPSEYKITETQPPQQPASTVVEEESEEIAPPPEPIAKEVTEELVVETIVEDSVEDIPETPIPVFAEVAEEPAKIPSQPVTDSGQETDSYLETVLLEIHRLTNKERKAEDLPLLEFDSELAEIATKHSEDMGGLDYFSHTSPRGCDLGCRFRNDNYVALAWGENIAWITTFEETSAKELAEQFMDSWMDSEGHRHNILSADFTHEGVGITQVDDKIYVTANFADPW